jgi:hypothetical protein
VIYCRRCDLAFCSAHRDEHDGDDHELVDNPAATFCCICSGIYLPKRRDEAPAA